MDFKIRSHLLSALTFGMSATYLLISASSAQERAAPPLPFPADHFRLATLIGSKTSTLGIVDSDAIQLPENVRDNDHLRLISGQFDKTEAQGANWILFKNKLFMTFDAEGYPHPKGIQQDWNIVEAGANFFILSDGSLYTVDQFGFFYPKPELGLVKPESVGGTYYVLEDKIITIASNGFYDDTHTFTSLGLESGTPIILAGSFFVANRKLFSVLTDGRIKNIWKGPLPRLKYRGGTYFFGQDGYLYRMAATGEWRKEPFSSAIKPTLLGFRHFFSETGKLYTLDSAGEDAEQSYWRLASDRSTETFRGLKVNEKR